MNIHRLPALSDNYIFLLHDPERQIAAVVDPAEPQPVLAALERLQANLVAIFNTHHHHDHVGANQALLRRFPQALVYGGVEDRGRIPGQQVFLQEGDRVEFGDRTATVLFVPGHTRAHIAYYFPPMRSLPDESDGAIAQQPTPSPAEADHWGDLFCGDTLFAGGCGRLFEGTPAQMVDSLTKLRQLPETTRVWCAHEYTLKNLQFALSLEPLNPDLQARFAEVKAARQQGAATIPSQIGIEKRTNPFLRWDHPDLVAAVQGRDPVQTFARLRGMKDQF